MSVEVIAQAKDYLGSREDNPETRTVATRERIRDKMSADIEAFLNGGGRINAIEPNVMADPPRKPKSEYGSQPI
jgi:hypothetical protein